MVNTHEEVLRCERLAVELHRRAFAKPTHEAMLFTACENAGVSPPRSPVLSDHDPWEEEIIRQVPLHVREEGVNLLRAARRLAEQDRLFSAEVVLGRLRALIDADAG